MVSPFRRPPVSTTATTPPQVLTCRQTQRTDGSNTLLRRLAQDPHAGVFDDDEILDSHAAPVRNVDARLDRQRRTGRKRRFDTRRGARRFMHAHADAMPETMPEILTIAGRADHVARQ